MISVLPQVLVNTLVTGSFYVLMTLGFNLIFGTAKFMDIGYGAMAGVGAYIFLSLAHMLGLGTPLSILLSVVGAGAVSLIFYNLVYKGMRQRKASNLVLLLASFGVFVLCEGVLAMMFTSKFQALSLAVEVPLSFYGVAITGVQIVAVILAFIISTFVIVIITYSSFGRAIKAVRDDEEVSRIVGIDTERVMRFIFFTGGAIAAVAGILFGLDTGVDPRVGFTLLLKAIISSVIGGAGSLFGGILGALLLSFTENFGVLFIGFEWKDTIAFGLLILFLIFRPGGIMKK